MLILARLAISLFFARDFATVDGGETLRADQKTPTLSARMQ